MSFFNRFWNAVRHGEYADSASPAPAAVTPPSPAPPPVQSDAAGAAFPNRAAFNAWLPTTTLKVGLDYKWVKEGVGGIGYYTQADGSVTTTPSPAVVPLTGTRVVAVVAPVAGIVSSSAPPTEENLTAYGHQNIPLATEIPGFVSFGGNMQPPATSVGQAYIKWNAAIAQRNTNTVGETAFQPGGEAFNLGGVDYLASVVLTKYNDLPEPKQAAALADPVIENALVVKLGRFAANLIVNRLRAGGAPGSYDYTSGFMTWFDSAGRHDEQVGQLY